LTYRTCPICHRELKPVEFDVFGKKRLMPISCQCEVDRMEQEFQAIEQAKNKQKIREIMRFSRIPARYANASLKNFEQLPGTQAAFREAFRYIKDQSWKKGQGLLFYGVTKGNGKTHLAAAIYNTVTTMGVMSLYVVLTDVLDRIKATYSGRDKYTEADILYWVAEADVVVLDDLGAERLTETNQELIYKIVNKLYNAQKSLIVTTNVDVENMESNIGDRVHNRLLEMCRWVENKGWSYRRRIAEQRLREQEVME
jgi:DNA replication protein DnaC